MNECELFLEELFRLRIQFKVYGRNIERMKVQTDYGEQELEEIVRCYNLWKKLISNNVQRRNQKQQTQEGKLKNRENSKSYYERHREQILAKRKQRYDARKNTQKSVGQE